MACPMTFILASPHKKTSSHEIYISGDNTYHFLLPEDGKEKKSSIHTLISQDEAQTLELKMQA